MSAPYELVPVELRERAQWIVWREEEREGQPTKVPYIPGTNRQARVNDPGTWTTFERATAFAEQRGIGIGFVFSADDPYAGLDLDDCIENGKSHAVAREIVRQLDSYTELSPSGTGLHVVVRAELNGSRHRTSATPWGGKFEVYDRLRFFTFTGKVVHGDYAGDRQHRVDELCARLLPEPAPKGDGMPYTAESPILPDAELLERAFAARDGDRVRGLYAGELAGYGSASGGDLAMLSAFAFWAGTGSGEQLDRLFRGSGRMRDKWKRSDYSERTITKALDRDSFYELRETFDSSQEEARQEGAALAAIPDYPVGALPVGARSLIMSTNLPVGLVSGAALAALAAAVGPKADLKVMGGWTERAHVWVALLAVRGAGKSPAMRLAFGPLHGRDALVDDDQEPLLTTDSTIEAVARIMRNADGAATVYLDELSVLLRGMGEYTGGGARGRWLALWSGEPWRYARVGGGGLKLAVDIRIAAPTVVIVGGLQPALHELLGGDEDGLRPRWLPHYAVPSVEPLKRGPASRPWSELIDHLLGVRNKPRSWELTDEAFDFFEQHRRTWLDQAADESETLSAALVKAPGHLARIALVLAEADAHGRGGAVLPSVVNRAARIVDYTLDSWRALPENGGLALTRRDAVLDQGVARLLAWLEGRAGRSADRRTVSRCRVAGARTPADLDALLRRFEATFPGTVTYEDPPRGGPRKQIVRAPARVVVTTGDTDTRAEANPHARAETGTVTTGDNDRGGQAGDGGGGSA